MIGRAKVLIACLMAAFLTANSSVIASAADDARVTSTASPEATAEAFYTWYLRTIDGNRDPFKDDRVRLNAYVTDKLIAKIETRMNSADGLDADYFLQAQDYLEDWPNHIAVTKSVTKNGVARTIIVLGARADTVQKLRVSLIKEAGVWKVESVKKAAR